MRGLGHDITLLPVAIDLDGDAPVPGLGDLLLGAFASAEPASEDAIRVDLVALERAEHTAYAFADAERTEGKRSLGTNK